MEADDKVWFWKMGTERALALLATYDKLFEVSNRKLYANDKSSRSSCRSLRS